MKMISIRTTLALLVLGSSLTAAAVLNGCSTETSSSSSSALVYGSSANGGDYADWTVDGDTLSADWKVINSTGGVAKTITFDATCGDADATFGYKTCTIASAGTCTDGLETCAAGDAPTAGGVFHTFEVPGVALMVKGEGEGEQLHVGFLKDTDCTDIAGDYTFMKTAFGSEDLFGIYRTDADFSNVTHADFGLDNSGNAINTPVIEYTTGASNGVESLTGTGCDDGVRTRSFIGPDGNPTTVRLAATASGAFILDLPAGQGGIVAFKTTNAATLSDFAGKTLTGISFPDEGAEKLIAVTTAAESSGAVSITSLAFSDDSTPLTGLSFKPVTNTDRTASNPSFPDFTTSVSGYRANALAATYATPSAIPGMFVVDGDMGSDTGRVFVIAMKVDGKLMAFGTTYNHRTSINNLANSGAFIVFEK